MPPAVTLRPVTEADLPALRRFFVEPEALGVHEWSGFSDAGFLDRRLRENGFLGPDGGWLVVVVEANDSRAGIVTWSKTRHAKNDASWCWNIGIALLPEHRGRGLGTQAQALLVTYLFETTAAVRLEAGTDVDNVAEQRALEKVGFARDGILRSAAFQAGQWRDVVLYSRLRSDASR